jgi:aryl-alcohol dehydrogenase-like predicted oxidoreductase
MQRHFFADGYHISRLIKGSWHLAGGHGAIERGAAIEDMARFVEAGITTFDCADIYTGVEALIGDFRRAYPAVAKTVQVHTKFVPDLDRLASVDANYVESIIDRSLQRLGMEALDLVQFHWWDYSVPGYVEAALALEALRTKGKIRRIGVTNFDTARLAELLAAGVRISTHQVQYSLLDRRPQGAMTDLCRAHGIGLLCYGTVLGGFLSERWLGRDEPGEPYANRSLTKYKLIIDDAGGWDTFQHLLKTLEPIAHRHGTDIASIGTAVVLDRPQVAAAIVGATNAAHLDAHRRLDAIRLAPDEHAAIGACLAAHTGPEGDVYTLERDRTGRHGRIMKYNLNT